MGTLPTPFTFSQYPGVNLFVEISSTPAGSVGREGDGEVDVAPTLEVVVDKALMEDEVVLMGELELFDCVTVVLPEAGESDLELDTGLLLVEDFMEDDEINLPLEEVVEGMVFVAESPSVVV